MLGLAVALQSRLGRWVPARLLAGGLSGLWLGPLTPSGFVPRQLLLGATPGHWANLNGD